MLDLDACVHLQEVVRPVRSEQPFDRPGRAVANRARGLDGDRSDSVAELGVDGRRRRLLDELLVPPLDRAVALAEMDDSAVVVGEDLNLDVPRIVEIPLHVHGRVRKVRLTFATSRLERPLDLLRCVRDLEPLAATASRSLDRDRISDLAGDSEDGVQRSLRAPSTPG